MSISTYIENLKAKPEHVRRRTAFWSAFAITAIIFLFWLGAMTGLTNSATTAAGNAVADTVARAGTPAQSLVAGVGAVFSDLKDLIFAPKKISYSTVEVRPGK